MTIFNLIKKHKKHTFLVLFVSILVVAFINQLFKDKSLKKNRALGIAKLLKIEKGRRRSYLQYQFYYEGKYIESSAPLRSGWPEHIREGKPVVRAFYPVEFDIQNPEYSKIIITESPLKLRQILKNQTTINGNILMASFVSDDYVDLRIAYKYQGLDFSFRTRLHKDSLPCGNVESCQESKIALIVSKQFPEVNNLYYKSYDRKKLLRKYRLN